MCLGSSKVGHEAQIWRIPAIFNPRRGRLQSREESQREAAEPQPNRTSAIYVLFLSAVAAATRAPWPYATGCHHVPNAAALR